MLEEEEEREQDLDQVGQGEDDGCLGLGAGGSVFVFLSSPASLSSFLSAVLRGVWGSCRSCLQAEQTNKKVTKPLYLRGRGEEFFSVANMSSMISPPHIQV